MKVSIIIPIYNAAKFIERSLRSALNQSYQSIEYILVDDGSSDDSLHVIDNLILSSPRQADILLFSHETNKGVAAARNTGMSNATGDYIYFLDSDDELPANAIEILVHHLSNTNANFVIGEFTLTGTRKKSFKTTKLNGGHYTDEMILDSFLLMQWPDMTCNKLVRLDTIRNYQLFFEEGIVHEDTLWSFMLALKSSQMVVCNETTYIYHIQEQSITQSKTDHNFKSLMLVLDRIIFLSVENELFDKKVHIRDYIIDYCFYFLKESVRWNKTIKESKNIFKEIRKQLKKIDCLSKDISRGSKMKLFVLRQPFYFTFFVFKFYLFKK